MKLGKYDSSLAGLTCSQIVTCLPATHDVISVRCTAAPAQNDLSRHQLHHATAGEIQADEVRKLKLPENFRILTLPHLKFARRYPTLGPNGALRTDINGCACSIELYLGTAALTGDNDSLIPVQWRGYESKLRRYQGELIDKKSVEERFLHALDAPAQRDEAELAPIRTVLQMIFTAFADKE